MTQHAFDAVSFAFGALFLIVGVMLLSGTPNADAMQWLGPAAAIGLGVLILVATVPRRRADAADEAAEDEPMSDAGEA
jgi:hypothetical protein